jgi:hypothetical protein
MHSDLLLNTFLSNIAHKNVPLLCLMFPFPRPAFAGLDDVVEQPPAIAYNEFLELLFC